MPSRSARPPAADAPWIRRSARERRGAWLDAVFGIDPRTLAVFRVLLGVLILVDLAIRATDLGAMLTDSGMFPRSDILRRYASPWNWSFHFASGGSGGQIALFGLAAMAAVALITGWRTRAATLVSWVLMVSLHHRNPVILNGGDILLRMLLFWGMFLPLGQAWSLDARRRAEGPHAPPPPAGAAGQVVSVASAAVLLQMALIYFVSAFFKSNPVWWNGQVIAQTLAHDFYAKPLGEWFAQFPSLLAALTVGVFVLEWVGPILLFWPRRTLRVRIPIVMALMLMHLAIELLLTVGLFSWVSMAGLVLFVPGEFWDRWVRHRPPLRQADPASAPPTSGVPAGGRRLAGGISTAVASAALAYVLLFNIAELPGRPLGHAGFLDIGLLRTGCGLGQRWNMFGEVPSKDGWYVAWAKLENGAEIDLLQGGREARWGRPAYPAGMFPNHRWRKAFREMAYADEMGYQMFRIPVARYLQRQWNAQNPEARQIAEFDFIYCTEQRFGNTGDPPFRLVARERLLNPVKPPAPTRSPAESSF